MANEFLRDRIIRKLGSLPDERLYQVLDFVEFLETKYPGEPTPNSNLFQRFAEGVEDRLRQGKVSATTIAETMNLMHKAIGVLNDVTTTGKSVASDIVDVASRAGAAATSAATSAAERVVGQQGGASVAPGQPSSGGADGTRPGPTPPPATDGGQPT